MKSAFVRNCLHTVMTLSLHSRSYTHAGELRWCKHEEGLKILIPHMDMDHLLCCSIGRRETPSYWLVAPYGAAAVEDVGAWPARGP